MSAAMAVEESNLEGQWEELRQLHEEALSMLVHLDRLGLFQAGAYVSMAIDVMRRQHPALDSCEGNSRTSG